MKLGELFRISSLRGMGAPPTPMRSAQKLIALCHSLLAEGSEAAGTHLTSEVYNDYQALDEPARQAFFDLLIDEFSPDPQEVGSAAEAYNKDPSPRNLARMQHAVEPPRQELFRRINMAAGGTRMLVEMRGEILRELKRHPQWESISADLEHLLTSWFNRGFLVRKRIDWNTSASVLEKLIQYEAVHQIQGWDDLRRRLQADRRCYAFFHPALPDEPIIFIEVALTEGISTQIQPLIDPVSPISNPEAADCAIFYSITNCQEGLRRVPLGNFLIKQVVESLGSEFPRLRKFSTLSPIPGFRDWLTWNLPTLEKNPYYATLPQLLEAMDQPGWFADQELAAELEQKLVPLCASYLLHARQGPEPLDAVARFHLRNGARVERINWMADPSTTGMKRSAGMMANYLYRLADVERNGELYAREHKVIASFEVESLAKQAVRAAGPARARGFFRRGVSPQS